MSTLALCPSRGRPAAAAATLVSFLETRRDPGSRIVFVVDRDDPTADRYPEGHTHLVDPGGCMGEALAAAARDRGLLGDATSVGMIGDDNRFRTAGWDVAMDGALTERPGIAYGDDGFQHERLPTSWWLSRPIVDAFGMTNPALRHFYMDNYWLELGRATGSLRYLPDVVIEHLHPLAGKAKDDAIYQRGHRFARGDRALHERWLKRGKERDLARLRVILGAGERRRVLADWHHPALWESLAILFEDRFGWELFSPIGTGWKRLGWRLENGTPGWTADDYLVSEEAVPRGDHWELTEPEYPERPRRMVTAEQFEAQHWDYIVASVPAHQEPFAAIARRRGARLINHVGDARRHVDRTIRSQVILASARVRGASVIYHQEFSRDLFAPAPIEDRTAVSSLMLRLDDTSGPYRWIADAPGIRWSAVTATEMRGTGYLAPMAAVADRMRRSGWVWHDKRIGDGYGHVLFNAAAMGRPLIGHASHYRGLLGEGLWEDLRTCIDLDRHDPVQALRLVRAISADPDWHDEMGAAIRERFERRVDFDAEAARIREVLA